MGRTYTKFELDQVAQAEKIMKQKGLVVDETEEDKDAATANAGWIVAWLDANPNIPATIESVLRACEDLKDKLVWKTQAEMDYESEYNNLTQAQKDAFGSWWYSPSTVRTIQINGQAGYYNAAKILRWCKGKTLNHATLNLAISNLASSHGSLYWTPTPKKADPRQHEDSGSFMAKSDTNLSALEQAKKRAAPEEKQTAAPTVDYKELAESVKIGRTHSDTAKLPQLFVMHPGTSQIDWKTTYFARLRLSEGKK